MKALTVRQPWASLIALGVKTIETRSWKAPDSLIGECIAIHAGAKKPQHLSQVGEWSMHTAAYIATSPEMRRLGSVVQGELVEDRFERGLAAPLPLGMVVCTAVVSSCWQMTDGFDWATMPERGVLDLGDHPETGVQNALTLYGKGDNEAIDLLDFTDDRPFGHYEPGRWAWYLTQVEQIDPVPAKGRLGLWEWKS